MSEELLGQPDRVSAVGRFPDNGEALSLYQELQP
jgi:hypothetical protein